MEISMIEPAQDAEPLPSPKELKRVWPLKPSHQQFVDASRRTIASILNRTSSKLLLIVGPCSIHDPQSAKEYAIRLRQLAAAVSDHFFIVMRVYFEKPRTSTGWKGLLYDPFLDGSHRLTEGLKITRQLLLDLAEMEIPAATEFLDPIASVYFQDLISWGCVGARTVTSQIHRQMASGVPMPVGFKNTVEGNIKAAIHAVLAAQISHAFLGVQENGQVAFKKTGGNPHTHLVLRGGEKQPNHDPASINDTLKQLDKHRLPKRVVIDCSHDNCRKNHENQPQVFQSVLHQVIEGNRAIAGLMIESHLNGGSQTLKHPLSHLSYGVSLTDPCLDWHSTEVLIRWAHEKLQVAYAGEISHIFHKKG